MNKPDYFFKVIFLRCEILELTKTIVSLFQYAHIVTFKSAVQLVRPHKVNEHFHKENLIFIHKTLHIPIYTSTVTCIYIIENHFLTGPSL